MTYCSMNDGDTCNAVAMLSKPSAMSSAGRNSRRIEVDRQQIANRVRVFLAVEPVQHDLVRHVRLAGGLDRASPRARRPASRRPRRPAARAPGGGMTRPRSLRTAFSNTSACWPIPSGVSPSKLTPPVLARSLWHPTQYWLIVASCAFRRSSGRTLADAAADREAVNTRRPANDDETRRR